MFLLDKRASGILMHISSLPGKTGIGTMGKNAYAFVDFLKETRLKAPFTHLVPTLNTNIRTLHLFLTIIH